MSTKSELLARARELGISGRSRMSIGQLRAAIKVAERKAVRKATEASLDFSPNVAGLEAIREVRKQAVIDDFEYGTVIRWTTDAGYNVYLYAAIKTPVGWATTAKTGNTHVEQVVTFEELLEILGRAETTDVRVAAEWTTIS